MDLPRGNKYLYHERHGAPSLPCEKVQTVHVGEMLHSLTASTTPSGMFEKFSATFLGLRSDYKARSHVSGFPLDAPCYI
jgi:hypothetical protein